jgi:D-3-phosphoglycerate dehydrogenase / 2-oxoglutarate reductase
MTMPAKPTVLVPDPEDVLMPYTAERQAAVAHGAEFVISQADPPQVQDAEIIITSLLRYPAEVVRELERCQLIVVYGIGYDAVDVGAATAAGIVVANTPTFCVPEVADHTVGLILNLARRIGWLDRQVRAGAWASAYAVRPQVHPLHKLTVGIIGLGNTAQGVIRRLTPFGCRILAYHPRRSAESIQATGAQAASFAELLRESDIISLHVRLTDETHHLIDERAFALMKPTALLVNTTRGAVVEETALIRALEEERIYGAALDVFEQEPPQPDNPLLHMDPQRVLLTPHFAGASDEALGAQQAEVAAAIAAFLQGEWPAATVNPTVKPKKTLR